jgi:UDP-N-acetylglucosamine:LPS N-acetylglucosamine transferase
MNGQETDKPHPKVCVGASAGGHTNELLALLEHAERWPFKPTICVTTMDIRHMEYAALGKTYIIRECNRTTPLRAFRVLLQSLRIARRERPDVLVTTGSMPLAIFACCVKLFGGKVVWIDSIAQVSEMSLSSRIVLLFADLCLVQREAIAAKDKRVEFVGSLL